MEVKLQGAIAEASSVRNIEKAAIVAQTNDCNGLAMVIALERMRNCQIC